MHLLEENKILKNKIYLISSKINLLCSICKNFFTPNQTIKNNNNTCFCCSNNNDDNIELDDNLFNNTHNTQSSSFFSNQKIQRIINFMLIALFSFIFIFCFFSYNLNNYTLRNNLENINQGKYNISLVKNDSNSIKNRNANNEDKINENNFLIFFNAKNDLLLL